MVIVRAKGGLGNQLFQYAAGYSYAMRRNEKLYIDTSFYPRQTLRGYKLDKFNTLYESELSTSANLLVKVFCNKYVNKILRVLKISTIRAGKDFIYLLETKAGQEEFFYSYKKSVFLEGYFQSERYFRRYRQDLLEQLTQKYEPEQEYLDVLNAVENCNSVAVHVRRGDYLKAQYDRNPRHYLLGKEYYHNAIAYMEQKLNNAEYFWFSDDIEWVKNNFSVNEKKHHFISLNTVNADIDEMMLMSKCKNIIAANSTFSWWSAWLNTNRQAIKTVPEKRYGNVYMIPENWVKISVDDCSGN